MPEPGGDKAAAARTASVRRSRVRAFARRRPLVTFLMLLTAAVAGMRLWWGWHLNRRLAAQRAEIRQRGEPVEPAEFHNEPVPDAQNAWVLLSAAGAADTGAAPANTQLEYADYPPFGNAWDLAAAGSEQTNGPVFQLARQARSRPRVFFRQSYPSPMFTVLLPGLNSARQTANTLGDGALYQHLHGAGGAADDVEAVERLRDTLYLAHCLHQDDPLVSQLVAIGIGVLAVQRTQIIAPGLAAEDPQTRRAMQALIAELLDDRPAAEGTRRSLVFERVALADLQAWQSSGTWVLRPLAGSEVVRHNEDFACYSAAARETNAAAAARLLERAPSEAYPDPMSGKWPLGGPNADKKVPRYSRWYSSGHWRVSRYFEQYYRGTADRRAAAVSLAARLYRADHGGRWPDQLDQLVPDYLPAVPTDPFYGDGRPMGYVVKRGALPDGGDRPLVYFDAGVLHHQFSQVVYDESGIDAEPMYGWQDDPQGRQPRVDVRQYRDLARWSPTVRRFDQLQKEREEAERAAREMEEQEGQADDGADAEPPGTGPSSAETVDDDPGQPDAPGDHAQEDDDAEQ